MSLGLILGLVAIVVLLFWMVRRGEEPGAGGSRFRKASRHADIDHDILEEAEREVRDVGLNVDPEEGFQGDDWGPGAPKQ
jgi:hypothetical protein